MGTNSRLKEVCHGCNKNILKHNKFVICNKRQKICHAKCANKLYNLILLRILGFAGNVALWKKLDTTHLNLIGITNTQPDNESFAKIHQIENFLDTCKMYDIKELNNLLKTPSESNEPLSIMFKNI